MAPKKTSARATKKVTKRPANATKATNMPSVADMNTLVKSNTTKRDRALIALATVSALGAAGAACGSSSACKNAVMRTATTVGGGMKAVGDHVQKAGQSVGTTLTRIFTKAPDAVPQAARGFSKAYPRRYGMPPQAARDFSPA